MGRVYRQLEAEFPQVDFVRGFMDPISKKRLIPDKRLRKVMYDPLPVVEPDDSLVALLGSEFAPDEDSDLRNSACGGRQAPDEHPRLRDLRGVHGLARAGTIVCVFPNGEYGARKTAERLGGPTSTCPPTF